MSLFKKSTTLSLAFIELYNHKRKLENGKRCGMTNQRLVFPQLFRVLPNVHECIYSLVETQKKCLLFFFRKYCEHKKETFISSTSRASFVFSVSLRHLALPLSGVL